MDTEDNKTSLLRNFMLLYFCRTAERALRAALLIFPISHPVLAGRQAHMLLKDTGEIRGVAITDGFRDFIQLEARVRQQ